MTNRYRAYRRTLSRSHRIKVVAKVYDRNEENIGVIDRNIIGGQVDVDTARDIERTLSLQLAGGRRKLFFDADDQDEVADKFIGVDYAVWEENLQEWHVSPVFFGPITRIEYDGFQVSLEAQDKSSLLFDPVVWGHFLKNAGLGNLDENTKYAARMMRAILDATGEDRGKMEFDDFDGARLPHDFKIPKHPESLWQVLKKIVRAANSRTDEDRYHDYRLFYDGRGRLRVESMGDAGFTFTDDPQTGVLISKPKITYDMTTFRNTVVLKIDRGQGGRQFKPIVVTLRDHHPMSPVSLRRNGVKRYLVEEISNSNIRHIKQGRQFAKSQLRKLSAESTQVDFECLPVPHLVPGARCRILTEDESSYFHVNRFSLPLNASGVMSVGYLKRVSINRTATKQVWMPRPPKPKGGKS